jgi:putative transposase
MSTYTQILYHIVFSTKERERVLSGERIEEFFRYTWGIVKNNHSHLYRINADADHVHLLSSLHPSVCLADFVKDIKTGTSKWIKEERVFRSFHHWQEGYAAFTLSYPQRDTVIEYIRCQQEHHHRRSFLEELRDLLRESGVEFQEKYLL